MARHNRSTSLSSIANFISPIQSLFSPTKSSTLLPDEDLPSTSSIPREMVHKKVELKIGGMTCGACVASIESQLIQSGIISVQVSLLAERGVVEYDENLWTDEKIVSEIEDIGFDAEVIEKSEIREVELRVYG